MAHILAIGIATLDIINTVDGYPAEDSEVRALAQHMRRGGNASNTLVVLSQLGHQCSWGGVWVDEPDARHICSELDQYNIDRRCCRVEAQGKVPTSYILLNQLNGSRSIVHYRNLPEYAFSDFQQVDLEPYDWLHFEGRNPEETLKMMEWARIRQPQLPISLEVEKPRLGIEALFPHASVLLFSPTYAASRDLEPEALLHRIHEEWPRLDLFCTKGAAGALALDQRGKLFRSRAFSPERVLDTLGAGDTFNAAVVDGYLRGMPMGEILNRSCRIAGIKVGHMGVTDLPLDTLQSP